MQVHKLNWKHRALRLPTRLIIKKSMIINRSCHVIKLATIDIIPNQSLHNCKVSAKMQNVRPNAADVSHFENKFREVLCELQRNTVSAISANYYNNFLIISFRKDIT